MALRKRQLAKVAKQLHTGTILFYYMFMYKIIQYLLFGHINLVRIFSIQHIDTRWHTFKCVSTWWNHVIWPIPSLTLARSFLKFLVLLGGVQNLDHNVRYTPYIILTLMHIFPNEVNINLQTQHTNTFWQSVIWWMNRYSIFGFDFDEISTKLLYDET
jgi:hypothetical protein